MPVIPGSVYTQAMRRPREPDPDSYAFKRGQIYIAARMRFGMVCGLLIIVLAQTLSGSRGESFEAIVRDLTPVMLIAAVGFTVILVMARRAERRLRAKDSRLRPRR